VTHASRAPTKLDLYLAGFLRHSVQGDTRLQLAGLRFEDARAVVDAVNATPFGGDVTVRCRRDMIITTFGPPDHDGPERMSYESILWPDHRYEYRLLPPGLVRWQGFVARTPRPAPDRIKRDGASLSHQLHIGYDTEDDVHQWLGPPADTDSWWPYSWSRYLVPTWAIEVTELNFEHGVLAHIGAHRVP
jgi:hypothetical protein